MAPIQFGSIVIYVDSDVKSVLDFYNAAFGLPIRYYDDGLKFGELETGEGFPTIMIASYAAGEYMVGEQFQRSANKRPQDIELAFLMEDVPAGYTRAVAAGAKEARAPRTMPWGQTVAYVSSIEGTLIGLLTTPPAPSTTR
jgi:lactoylglutathione lyase